MTWGPIYHHNPYQPAEYRQLELVRECRECRGVKPIAEFRHVNGYPREHVCRGCKTARTDRWRRENAEEARRYQREYHRQRNLIKRVARDAAADNPPSHWWTVQRAAIELRIVARVVRHHCKNGRLVARLTSNTRRPEYRIDPESVRRYAQERYT